MKKLVTCYFLSFSDKYLKTEEVKERVEQLRKISSKLQLEMAGMTNYYTLDQDKLKIRLLVTKQVGRQTLLELPDYKELFGDFFDQSLHTKMRLQFYGRKIILKGENGMGKSLLAKKIVLDWAKGKFCVFPVVVFIDLTLAKAGDTIESIIAKQSGLSNVELLISRCLVVIDGLEDSSKLDNVLKFVKPHNRNVLVTTSDCHLADSIEMEFDTVGTLQGLSEQDIISSMNADLDVQSVTDIEVSLPSAFLSSKGKNPMITTFKGILVSKELKLETKNISLCQVYFQLVRLLHGSSDDNTFQVFAKEMGKLALESLQFGTFSPQESDVPDWLITKSTNGIMSFVNRSIETFLAALYFVFAIEETEIQSVLNAASQDQVSGPIFMMHPLFLHFCLALLGEESILGVSNSVKSYDTMKECVREKIDLAQFDLQDISVSYPALITSASEDDLGLRFLLDVLKICDGTQDFILVPTLPIGMILNSVNVTSPQLKLILLGEEHKILQRDVLDNISTEYLNIIVDNQASEPLDQLLNWLAMVDRPFAMFFVAGNQSAPMVDFTLFANPNLKGLYMNSRGNFECDLVARREIPTFPSLQSMEVVSEKIKLRGKIVDTLVNALDQGCFPKLSRCNIIGNNRAKLSQWPWPSLNKLSLQDTHLDKDSKEHLRTKILPNIIWFEVDQNLSSVEDLDNKLTKLSGLRLFSANIDFVGFAGNFKEDKFQNLRELELVQLSDVPKDFLDVLTAKTVPQLHKLVLQGTSGLNLPENFTQNEVVTRLTWLSLKKFAFFEGLSSLFRENDRVPYLERLTLVDCGLSKQDVRCLAQASVEDMLPNLKHLDLSENKQIGGSRHLFDLNCRWEKLLSLNIECKDQQSYGGEEFSDFLHLTEKSLSGCLSSLEELKFSTQNPDCVPRVKSPCWPRLKALKISSRSWNWKQFLSPLVDLVDQGGDDVLPALEAVTLCLSGREPPPLALEKQMLRRNGVRVYFTECMYY